MPKIPEDSSRHWVPKKQGQQPSRDTDGNFYRSRRWRKVREQQLIREPLCRECLEAGVVKAAEMVDHIQPIKQGGDKYAPSNLQSLCNKHHNIKRGRERHGK